MGEPRRKDRVISENEAVEILKSGNVLALATVNEDGTPYVVPVNYAYIDGAVYFHSAVAGQKFENIKRNPNVCLYVMSGGEIIEKKLTTYYESVVVKGKAYYIEDDAEKIRMLTALGKRLAPNEKEEVEKCVSSGLKAATGICKITVEEMTGKANRGKQSNL